MNKFSETFLFSILPTLLLTHYFPIVLFNFPWKQENIKAFWWFQGGSKQKNDKEWVDLVETWTKLNVHDKVLWRQMSQMSIPCEFNLGCLSIRNFLKLFYYWINIVWKDYPKIVSNNSKYCTNFLLSIGRNYLL